MQYPSFVRKLSAMAKKRPAKEREIGEHESAKPFFSKSFSLKPKRREVYSDCNKITYDGFETFTYLRLLPVPGL
ncbi:hypothetical protein DSO57_1025720 [Entomophthora muscae]|uniref:Uncharacterized protein n=2 Tax=Entomophthora muscae TaxID=34485 RepID=A0ACC2TAT3_9FUNG|nr:hypothetical protein DSO57_1033466 [Entomophthora muscae]KAJ9084333.1 hypothetical protein DSO57_1025720 [Entomophthora muscae]